MIGLELDDARVSAVSVDGDGNVLARAAEDAGDDLGAAAGRALARVQGGAGLIGVAAINPDGALIAPVVAQLAQRIGHPSGRSGVVLSGTASAVAEAWIGAARGVADVVYFAVAQHATGGVVRDGMASTGARGRAGSVAWLSLNPVEREDYRKTGCLEAEVAAAGIVRRMIWRIKAGDRSRVQDAVKDDLGAITVEHILNAARQDDGVAVSVVRDTARYIGMAIANLATVLDPDVVVVAGVIASAADLLLEPSRGEALRRVSPAVADTLRIVAGQLGADAAALGAARAAMLAP